MLFQHAVLGYSKMKMGNKKQKYNIIKTKTKIQEKTKTNNQRHKNNRLPLERWSAAKHYHIYKCILTQCIWI